jgi:hypothetical protein
MPFGERGHRGSKSVRRGAMALSPRSDDRGMRPAPTRRPTLAATPDAPQVKQMRRKFFCDAQRHSHSFFEPGQTYSKKIYFSENQFYFLCIQIIHAQ